MDAEFKKVNASSQKGSIDYSLGEQAVKFSLYSNSDALVLISFRGETRSASSIASETFFKAFLGAGTMGMVMLPLENSGYESLHIALVEGKKGDIVWSTGFPLKPGQNQMLVAQSCIMS